MTPPVILVAEDEPLVRDMIATELREAGFTVLEAPTAADALGRIEAHPEIDLLLTDVMLGRGASGWDVAVAFRERHPQRPVIYATAFAPGEPRRVPGSVLFDKPYLPSQITQMARLLLSRRTASAPAVQAPAAVTAPMAAGDPLLPDPVEPPEPPAEA